MLSSLKRSFVIIVSIMAGFTLASAHAQPRSGPAPNFDGAMAKLFGANTAFSANLELHASRSAGDEMTMPGRFAALDGKFRFDMDMSKIQGGHIPPEAVAKMKQMGMGTVATITSHDKKMTYILYPDMKAYVEQSTPQAGSSASDYKSEVTKLGEETVDGHACVKNKVIVTGPDGVKHESTVWNATDLKEFPLKVEMAPEKGTSVVLLYKNVKLGKPDAQFDIPSDYKKYDDMMSLMMSRSQKPQ